MKIKYVLPLGALLLTCLTLMAIGQPSNLQINGTVLDQESGVPVPYAHVSLSNSTRGTAADEAGIFQLVLKPYESKEYLKISSIGFLTRLIKIDSLQRGEPLIILLEPDAHVLNEIEVTQKPMDPAAIVQTAIDSLSINYHAQPFNAEYYSILTAENVVSAQQYQLETIITGFYPGYVNTKDKRFEVIKKRAKGENPLTASDYPFWPTLEIHRADLIASPDRSGTLNPKNVDDFLYTYRGLSMYDADTVYQIDYLAPKPNQKITGYGVVPKVYKGTIFISTTQHAIVKHDIETDQFAYSIIYTKLYNVYFPYLISGERKARGDQMFTKVKNIVRLIRIELENVKVIDYKTNEFENISALPDDEAYWELNFPQKDY